MPEVTVIMIISESEASISFPLLDGNLDYPSFFGSDPAFLKRVNDMFLYYWQQAKICVLYHKIEGMKSKVCKDRFKLEITKTV